jgi:hypothetical protein
MVRPQKGRFACRATSLAEVINAFFNPGHRSSVNNVPSRLEAARHSICTLTTPAKRLLIVQPEFHANN